MGVGVKESFICAAKKWQREKGWHKEREGGKEGGTCPGTPA